jgi:8-oxo-dGTP pyrophosphatase MutT (NUDIX family)
VTALGLPPAWLAQLAGRRDVPPLVPREPLWAGDALVGSVEPDFFERLGAAPSLVNRHADGWRLAGEAARAFAWLERAMREAGLAHVWRDEQLPVTDPAGRVVGSIERAVVRPLGITTFAVHLAGFSPEGRHWVQQRSLAKSNDPGMWDTLMGGMVPSTDTLEQALERETWEEAGLRMSQLQGLRHGGRVLTRRPTGDARGGYIVEWIDWFSCVVPAGVEPKNQDGEVERFELLEPREVASRLLGDGFTLEAALVLTESALDAPCQRMTTGDAHP